MDRQQLLKEADRCVKCGLCLPHCPTYRISHDEGDSPRGRIALIQAYTQQLVDTPRLHRHLDRCLGCLACERACPSGVNYGTLIDSVRTLQPKQKGVGTRLRVNLLSRLPYLKGVYTGLRFYQRSGGRTLLRAFGGSKFRRLDALLPDLAPADPGEATKADPGNGRRIGLFTGCVGRVTEGPALHATQQLLSRLGYQVIAPGQQACCGALHQHNGQTAGAAKLAAINSQTFNAKRLDAILFLASGCGVQLLDYARLRQPFDAPVLDACQFLLQQLPAKRFALRGFNGRILLHTPCSAMRLPTTTESARALLEMIPGMEIDRPESDHCCGAAGSYLLTQPRLSDQLREPLLTQAGQNGYQAIVTTNTGCALHLAAGLKGRGIPIPVLHPLELFAQQLDD